MGRFGVPAAKPAGEASDWGVSSTNKEQSLTSAKPLILRSQSRSGGRRSIGARPPSPPPTAAKPAWRQERSARQGGATMKATRGRRPSKEWFDGVPSIRSREQATDYRTAETWSENKAAAKSLDRSRRRQFASVRRVGPLAIRATPTAAWRPRSSPCGSRRWPANGRPG
jgi:hypothetical protein